MEFQFLPFFFEYLGDFPSEAVYICQTVPTFSPVRVRMDAFPQAVFPVGAQMSQVRFLTQIINPRIRRVLRPVQRVWVLHRAVWQLWVGLLVFPLQKVCVALWSLLSMS